MSKAHAGHGSGRTASLAVAALGIVYGDIGTSPLYAFRQAFAGPDGLVASTSTVMATLSALFWSVMVIISFKYVWIVLRFNNDGEGGVLALTALASRLTRHNPAAAMVVISLGIFAGALFYGDAIITPAISVLSAIEGLSVAVPRFQQAVVPLTIAILIALFCIQRRGTGQVGRLFGPITIVWFTAIGLLGLRSIITTPAVLAALNPAEALHFAWQNPHAAFLLLAAVFLALTGGEALYADMGHFGAQPVRIAWYGLVCPSLMLNYFGQGALVLREPAAAANPFYLLTPEWLLLPMVALAAAATVIASQATITGAYSLTVQAARLGYLPRMYVMHTSDTERGQVYLPGVNWFMLVGVVLLVAQFRSSDALASAYGIAVSGTMLITTMLTAYVAYVAMRAAPGWRHLRLIALLGCGILEIFFLSSNMAKVMHGGWLPLCLGATIFLMLTTWKEGSRLVALQRRQIDISLKDFLISPMHDVPRVPGTAVYLTSDPSVVPSALFHNIKFYQIMHERIVFLHVITEEIPMVPAEQRLQVTLLAQDIYAITARFGFREEPNIPLALTLTGPAGLTLEPMLTTYFVARSTIVEGDGRMPRWRTGLYSWMTRQAEAAANYFQLPPNRVVEIGTQVLL